MADIFEDTQVITNPGPASLQVCLEPWGRVYLLPPGESFRVEGRSSVPGRLKEVREKFLEVALVSFFAIAIIGGVVKP